MRAIYINVRDKEITEIELEKGIDAIYEKLECTVFTCPLIDTKGDSLYVDDEGLLNDNSPGSFFHLGYPTQPLFGHGLIIGTDDEGESTDAKVSLENVKALISFIDLI